MKKFTSFFLLSFFLINNSTHAFWWDESERSNNETHQKIWDDPFFSDPFFSYHKNFMNRWGDDIWEFSFPKISIANNYPLDLEEQDDTLVATIDIPKFDPEDIEIEVKNDRWLIIRGSQENEESEDNRDKKYYYRERSSGNFSRQVLLPHPVDKSTTSANFKEGTLTILLPKKSTEPVISDYIPITIE